MGALPDAPDGLEARGRRLWGDLVADTEFDPHELALLLELCRAADTVETLAAQIAADGYMIAGSQGQPVLHPAVGELRQQQAIMVRLVSALSIPGADATATLAEVSSKAQHAAQARWSSQRKKVARG